MDKVYLTVSRKWKNPEIATTINDVGIGVSITLDSFVNALKQEIGSVAFVFKKQEIDKKIDKAVENILYEMKTSTEKVATQIPPDLIS